MAVEHAAQLEGLAAKLFQAETARDEANARASAKGVEASRLADDAEKAQHVARLQIDALQRDLHTSHLELERWKSDSQVRVAELEKTKISAQEKALELKRLRQEHEDDVAKLTSKLAVECRSRQAEENLAEAAHHARISELQRALDVKVEMHRSRHEEAATLARELREARALHNSIHKSLLCEKTSLEQELTKALSRVVELEDSERNLATAALQATAVAERYRSDTAKLTGYLIDQTT